MSASAEAKQLYLHVTSWRSLLSCPSASAVRLAGAVRKYRQRHKHPSLEVAFERHRTLTLSDEIHRRPHASSSSTLLDSVIVPLRNEITSVRAQIAQHNTPRPFNFRSLSHRFLSHLSVLSIYGDGRCLMYSLLQVGVAQLPSHVEADRLRHQLKEFLLSSYTDDEWYNRVPALLTDGGRSRQAFADKFHRSSPSCRHLSLAGHDGVFH